MHDDSMDCQHGLQDPHTSTKVNVMPLQCSQTYCLASGADFNPVPLRLAQSLRGPEECQSLFAGMQGDCP